MDGFLKGPRHEIDKSSSSYPEALRNIPYPPKKLYVIGAPEAMSEGLAVVGARKATPYGRSCARHFSAMAAERGIGIISGGARGCDSEAHRSAIEHMGKTVVFLGGGCDRLYPKQNANLFQEAVNHDGAVVSEHDWDVPPLPQMFRTRNRLIAGLAKATLIVEAGLPSGTFSTADEALNAGKAVFAVPGAITSPQSKGSNRLISQGAHPVTDDETFNFLMFQYFGSPIVSDAVAQKGCAATRSEDDPIVDALNAEQMTLEQICRIFSESRRRECGIAEVMGWLASMQKAGIIAKFPNGRYGGIVKDMAPRR